MKKVNKKKNQVETEEILKLDHKERISSIPQSLTLNYK